MNLMGEEEADEKSQEVFGEVPQEEEFADELRPAPMPPLSGELEARWCVCMWCKCASSLCLIFLAARAFSR
jgi:hypothetical protein